MDNLAPWKILESTMSYEDQWLRVRSDKCMTSQGLVIEPYHVLECSTWVNILALTSDGDVVLVREYRHGIGEVLLGLPGGAVEDRDTNPCTAIQRELLEETGYSGGQFFEIGRSYPNAANQNNTVWSFLALDVFKLQKQNLDKTENIEIVLQDLASFYQQAWSGEIPMQALYLTTLGFATHFIVHSKLPQLETISNTLRKLVHADAHQS